MLRIAFAPFAEVAVFRGDLLTIAENAVIAANSSGFMRLYMHPLSRLFEFTFGMRAPAPRASTCPAAASCSVTTFDVTAITR